MTQSGKRRAIEESFFHLRDQPSRRPRAKRLQAHLSNAQMVCPPGFLRP